MRILILTQFYPPEFGAAAVYWSRLAQMLAEDGHHVTILTSVPNYPTGIIPDAYRKGIFFREQNGNVEIIRVSVYASPKKNARARILNQLTFMAMAMICGTFLQRADVMIVESHPLFVCVAASWLKHVKRMPIILNVSDLWPESAVATGMLQADSLFVRVAEYIERWAYNDADHLVAMTRGVQEGINRTHHLPDRTTLLYNSVDLEQFRPGLETERAVFRQHFELEGQFIAAHVGNMSLTYDFNLLLNVATQLPQITFLFVGGGSQQVYVTEQIAALKLQNVKMLGILPFQDMPALWASTDICLIALGDHSVAGGTMPAKLFEAMATGTPIVAAIRGEAEVVLRESGAGITTPIGDVQSMVEGLTALYRNKQRLSEMSQAGRQYASSNFSSQHTKSVFLDIIRGVHEKTKLRYIKV